MRLAIVLLLLLATAAGGGAAVLIDRRLDQPAPAAAPAIPPAPATVPVLVAARDLASGTILAETDYRTVQWPADSLPETALIAADIRPGETLLRMPVPSGAPLLAGQVVERGAGGTLAYVLAEGHVATAVAVTETTGVAGHVAPGDRVDILFTHAPSHAASAAVGSALGVAAPVERAATETLLVGIKVLAIDQRIDDTTGEIAVGRTATLEVTPKEAEMLALAQTIGTLSLVLNGVTPAAEVPDPKALFIARRATQPSYTLDTDISALFRPPPEVLPVALSDPEPAQEPEPAPAVPVVAEAEEAPPPPRIITIIRGSSMEQISAGPETEAPAAETPGAAPSAAPDAAVVADAAEVELGWTEELLR